MVQVSVSSGSASQTTLRLKRVSGGEEVAQMCNEVKVIGKEDRGAFKGSFLLQQALITD